MYNEFEKRIIEIAAKIKINKVKIIEEYYGAKVFGFEVQYNNVELYISAHIKDEEDKVSRAKSYIKKYIKDYQVYENGKYDKRGFELIYNSLSKKEKIKGGELVLRELLFYYGDLMLKERLQQFINECIKYEDKSIYKYVYEKCMNNFVESEIKIIRNAKGI